MKLFSYKDARSAQRGFALIKVAVGFVVLFSVLILFLAWDSRVVHRRMAEASSGSGDLSRLAARVRAGAAAVAEGMGKTMASSVTEGLSMVVAGKWSCFRLGYRLAERFPELNIYRAGDDIVIKDSSNREIWRINCLPPAERKPCLSIVIDDVGYDIRLLKKFLELNDNITYAVIPDTPRMAESQRLLRTGGFEMLIHIPMEPVRLTGYEEQRMLRPSMSEKEIKNFVRRVHAELPYAVGINNHMGSLFTSKEEPMRVFLDEVFSEGLFFLDSRTTAKTVVPWLGKEYFGMVVSRDMFLDNVDTVDAVLTELYRACRRVGKKGDTIAIGHLHKNTFKALQIFLNKVSHCPLCRLSDQLDK